MRILAAAALLMLASGCINLEISFPWVKHVVQPVVEVGDAEFKVEVADSERERRKGLSGRSHLPPSTGMLFIPDRRWLGEFWMKGMRFPLDFIWVGANCEVVDYIENVPISPPGADDNELRRYASLKPTAYVLEVNAGDIERFAIDIGDDVSFKDVGDGWCGN